MRSYSFTHAITRLPAPSILDGLRAVDTGAPDLALMLQHFKQGKGFNCAKHINMGVIAADAGLVGLRKYL